MTNIIELVSPKDVLLDVKASNKARAIAELSLHSARQLGIAPNLIRDAIMRREELGSTGLGGGIAVPHTRLDQIVQPFGVVARLRSPVPFDAVDDQPVDLVALLLLPTGTAGDHLNALACVARRLRDPRTGEAMRAARDVADLYACLTTPS